MPKFPMKFDVRATASDGMGTSWTATAAQLSPIPCSIPPEFAGPGGAYSPEDLFALAVLNCIIATYKVYCEKAKVRFLQIEGQAALIVDLQEGSLTMVQIDIELTVKGASDPEKARKTLDHAIRDCAVSNAVKSGKTFKISIS